MDQDGSGEIDFREFVTIFNHEDPLSGGDLAKYVRAQVAFYRDLTLTLTLTLTLIGAGGIVQGGIRIDR